MKRPYGFAIFAALATLALAQTSGRSLLSGYVLALNSLDSVSGTYTAQTIGEGQRAFSIALKKPNLARIETPSNLWVADGKSITVLNKDEKTYAKYPQTPADLSALFGSDELNVWAGFFDASALKTVVAKAVADKPVDGKTMRGVEAIFDPTEKRVITYYLDPTTKIPGKAVISYSRKSRNPSSTVLDLTAVKTNTSVENNQFAFVAPEDAKEISLQEMNGVKWFTDLEEAKIAAKKADKRIFAVFMSKDSATCRQMEKELFPLPEFKALGKKFVFLKVDASEDPTLAAKFAVIQVPTEAVIESDGTPASILIGYANPADIFAWIKSA